MQNNIKRIDTKSAFSAEEEDEAEIVETILNPLNQPQTLLAKIIFFYKNVPWKSIKKPGSVGLRKCYPHSGHQSRM